MSDNWSDYPNGQIPLSILTKIQSSYLEPNAAKDFNSFAAAFKKKFSKTLILSQGYRPLGKKTDAADADAPTQWAAWNHYIKVGSPLAATPGTSNHGTAQAGDLWSGVDTFGTAEHNWAVANGPKYGWKWGAVPSEAWHFEHLSTSVVYSPLKSITSRVKVALTGQPSTQLIEEWHQVMGFQGLRQLDSNLVKRDQGFLNSVVPGSAIKSLTGISTLHVTGINDSNTIKVRQYYLFNKYAKTVLGRPAKISDFSGKSNKEYVKLLQYALNNAPGGARKY